MQIISGFDNLTTRMWSFNSDAQREIYEENKSSDNSQLEEILKNSTPELPLEQFLKSGAIETLSPALKSEYGIQ